MTDTEVTELVARTLEEAERCDAFVGTSDLEPCDGLEGCRYCLRNAAAEVLAVLDVRRTRGAA